MMKRISTITLLLVAFCQTNLFASAPAQKPDIWLLTDLTGFKVGEPRFTHEDDPSISQYNTQSDPDDFTAISIYLMKSNEFNTVRIIMGNDRDPKRLSTDALQEFKDTFVPAYRHDVKYWNSPNGIGGYPSAEEFEASLRQSSTQGQAYADYTSYKDFDKLPSTVQELVVELQNEKYSYDRPLYVLIWGPLTEVAMAIRHFEENDNLEPLNNLYIVSHWTTSHLMHNEPSRCAKEEDKVKFGVANCNEDCVACDYVHQRAAQDDCNFRFVDIGSIGQSGLVDGSVEYFADGGVESDAFKAFCNSSMGEVFITSNFLRGRPDGSDAATLYVILGRYGISLDDFSNNGVLTIDQEQKGRDVLFEQARYILDELLAISNTIPNSDVESKYDLAYPLIFRAQGNPLVRHIRTADPDCHVWEDGRLWMYTSQDHDPVQSKEGGSGYAKMDGYHVFSTCDMDIWIDHGEILHSRDVEWGSEGYMWAPGAAYKDGVYYLYYPHTLKDRSWKSGVATSKYPQGPFTDSGKYIEGTFGIDPHCFIDDDGQAYLFFAQHVAKLKPNMMELAEEARVIDYGANDRGETNENMVEAPWMIKRDGKYYFSYSNFRNKEYQGFYGVSSSPYGPFEWKGAVNPAPKGAQDHHSVIEYKGQWYYFYHLGNFTDHWDYKGRGNRRNVCVDYLYFDEDGSYKLVEQTEVGVKKVN